MASQTVNHFTVLNRRTNHTSLLKGFEFPSLATAMRVLLSIVHVTSALGIASLGTWYSGNFTFRVSFFRATSGDGIRT